MKNEIVGRQVYYAGKFYKITDVIEPTRENNYYCNHYILLDGRELYEVRSTDCVFVKNKDVFHKITPLGAESAEIDKYLYENGIFVDSVLHGGFEDSAGRRSKKSLMRTHRKTTILLCTITKEIKIDLEI